MTLAGENRQLTTHKMIISSSSPALNFDSTFQNSSIALERQQELQSEQVYKGISEELSSDLCAEISLEMFQ